jgi:hypothetical protein
MGILMLIPSIFSIAEKIFGAVEPAVKTSIVGQLISEVVDGGLGQRITSIFTQTMTGIEEEKKLQFQLELQSMIAQTQMNTAEIQTGSTFQSGWRPSLAWLGVIGIGINTVGLFLFHLVLFILAFTTIDPQILLRAQIQIPLVDVTLLGTLLIQMLGVGTQSVLRTFEKYNNLQAKH